MRASFRVLGYLITIILIILIFISSENKDSEIKEQLHYSLILAVLMLFLGVLSYKEWFKLPKDIRIIRNGSLALIAIYLCSLGVDILTNNEVVEWDRAYLIENTLIAFSISLLLVPGHWCRRSYYLCSSRPF